MGLLIHDDGVGSDSQEGGYGLMGMRERVNLLEGSMKIRSAKGQGFEIDISIPEKQ